MPLSGLCVIDLTRALAGPFLRLGAGDNRAPAAKWGRLVRMSRASAGLFFALLCACPPVPEAEFALASVTPTTARIDAGLAAVTVEPASRDRAVYPLPRSLTPLLPLWQAALQDAVTRQGIFLRTQLVGCRSSSRSWNSRCRETSCRCLPAISCSVSRPETRFSALIS